MREHFSCTDPDRLCGLLTEPRGCSESDELLEHLASCRRCQVALERLAVGGTGWLQHPPVTGISVPPDLLRGVMDSLKTRSFVALSGGALGDLSLDFLAPSDHPGALGQVGGYPVLAVVGRGGMGVVFTALDKALNRTVAVKVLDPKRAGNGTDRQRFVREARAVAAVSHPNVVRIHAVEEGRGLPYLGMEYVPGGSLQDKIDRDGALGAADAVRVALQTAEGLAAAHVQGIVHRDVKPANILLENGVGRVRLTDF